MATGGARQRAEVPPDAPNGRDVVLAAIDVVREYTTGARVQQALAGVSLEVRRGGFVAIMGPSGSGKSTLLHLLGGLDTPTRGEVRLGGRSLAAMSDRELTELRRKDVGFVFQFFNLVPVLSAAENVELPAVIAGEAPGAYRRGVDEALAMVDLSDHRDKVPAQLSGGEQQRVAIARALARQPSVLLADEPTGNLDSASGLAVLDLLRRAQRERGQTVVLVTHDPRAASFAEELYVLRDGAVAGHVTISDTVGADAADEERYQAVLRWLQQLEGGAAHPAPAGPRRLRKATRA